MASVFLSYDHGDANRAEPIADALEKAGHSVWWDRHIAGGTEYNSEIESAVERSDAVVVLWSKRSVKSAWVRDEAAEGRDQGKLIPLLIDPVKPPMGFRQFQTIDISQRGRRGRDPAMAELFRAIERYGGPTRAEASVAPSFLRHVSPKRLAGFAMVALAVMAIALWQPWGTRSSTLSVTVVPSEASAGAREFARNLMVQLGSLQGPNADALNLVEPESEAKPHLTFKVSGVGGTTDPRASLSLIDNPANTLLWSREFVQPGGNQADLRQQVAYSTGQVLRCATEALAPDHPKLKLPTLKLYLNGCADLSNLIAQDASLAIPTFRKVSEEAPTFAGGWAKLILAEMFTLRQVGLGDRVLRKDLHSHIKRAREIDPAMADADLAESWLQTPRPISGWMRFADRAVAKNPLHAEALMNRAMGLAHAGRLKEAIADVKRAVQVEPLYPAARDSLIATLMYSGAIDAANNELRKAERLWPGASNLLVTRFTLEYRYGDPKEAMRILNSGQLAFTATAAQRSFLEARLQPSQARINQAIADARMVFENTRDLSTYAQTVAQFGRTDEVAKILLTVDPRVSPGIVWALFRPAFHNLRHDPRFIQIAGRYELIPYWRETGRWPDFCSERDLPYNCKNEASKQRG